VLVTHSISFLPQVDQIIMLQDGCVAEVGSYKQLVQQAGAFSDFLKNYLMEILVGDDDDKDEHLDANSTIRLVLVAHSPATVVWLSRLTLSCVTLPRT